MLEKNCNEVELPSFRADSLLNVIKKQPDEKLSELTNATAVAGTPALLNLLTNLLAPIIPAATGIFKIKLLGEGEINYGSVLLASSVIHTNNTGFNFSPNRDMSEAVFWNPSAMVNSKKSNNISLFTNVKNNIKLGGFSKITDKISLGGGVIYTWQDEFRSAVFFDTSDPDDSGSDKATDSVSMKLKEYGIFLSPAFKVNNK